MSRKLLEETTVAKDVVLLYRRTSARGNHTLLLFADDLDKHSLTPDISLARIDFLDSKL